MDKQQTQPDAELSRLSPFELKSRIIAAADEKVKNAAYTLLNAGRGNPNWIATEARRAFFALGQFAMDECESHGMLPEGIAAIPVKEGISVRFEEWMRDHKTLAGVDFLRSAYEYTLVELAADADALVYEWTDGIIGDHYPTLRAYCNTRRSSPASSSNGRSAPAIRRRTRLTSSQWKARQPACATASTF